MYCTRNRRSLSVLGIQRVSLFGTLLDSCVATIRTLSGGSIRTVRNVGVSLGEISPVWCPALTEDQVGLDHLNVKHLEAGIKKAQSYVRGRDLLAAMRQGGRCKQPPCNHHSKQNPREHRREKSFVGIYKKGRAGQI
jgi:hypothetical protein